MVEYHPISAKDFSKNHQFGKNVIPGIFLGCDVWKGDVLIADLEDLEKLDVSSNNQRERSVDNTKRR